MLRTIGRYIVGTLVFPAIVGYILSYRLIGVDVTYRWGEVDVRPTRRVNQSQFLFSRMFPMAIGVLLLAVTYWLLGV
jgi:hypothetical protein